VTQGIFLLLTRQPKNGIFNANLARHCSRKFLATVENICHEALEVSLHPRGFHYSDFVITFPSKLNLVSATETQRYRKAIKMFKIILISFVMKAIK
jgi:hypothetical protein